MQERVQKIIAAAGITSRRQAEQLILEGRVRVNGQVVTEMGVKADPDHDHIKVDGKLINPKQPLTYVMLNKPLGHMTTMSDPEGRPMVSDLLKGLRARVYPVGRLDYNTEGLLLLTNDGDFAHLVMHPSHELPKTYLVKVKGVLGDREVEQLEKGVFLQDGKTAPAQVRRLRKEEANSWIEITIHEGRKRQVRRMIDHTGHSVIKLKRTRIGSLNLGDLPVGTYRHLTPEEVQALRDMVQGPGQQPAPFAAGAPVRKAAPDWKRMEVEAIPGPVRRERKSARERPAAVMRGPGKERARSGRAERPAWSGQRADQRSGERRPRREEQRGERPAFQGRGPASRTAGPGTGSGFRPREAGKRPFGDRAQRPGGKQPWQGKQRGERPAFPGRAPSSRTGGTGTVDSFRPRQSARKPFGQGARRTAPREQRPEGRGAWQSDTGAGRTFEGARRPFVKKGPRPAGGPRAGGGRPDDRRGGYGRPEAGSRERTASRGTWQAEKRSTKPPFGGSGRSSQGRPAGSDAGTSSRAGRGGSIGARTARPEGKRPWQASSGRARPRTQAAGPRPGPGRLSGGAPGRGRPEGFRPSKGRGPKRG
jgi:23S rRNA pseudouridine2605 synthase